MRNRVFEIIELGREDDKTSLIYDICMFLTIIISLIPLTTKSSNSIFTIIDIVTVCIFIVDYLLRLCTADIKMRDGMLSFVKYPFTFMAIIDLISILPSLIPVNSGLKVFKLLRMGKTLKAFKMFKIIKTFRYSKNISIIVNVFKKQKDSLTIVGWLAVTYVLISALIIFNVEPDTFDTFFDAVYWAVVSLTTVGYGDVYCISVVGKIITMISALFGIAIVALPAGILTAGYMEEIAKDKNE